MTISPDGYPIDASYNLDFSIGCVFPCKTCDEDQSKCLTCLTLEDGTPLNFFKDKTQSTCLPECPIGWRENKQNECEECDEKCATCSEAVGICDSCSLETGWPYLYRENNECLKECVRDGVTYTNEAELTCDPCINNC